MLITPKKPTYILRSVNADMTSYNGFVWPASGYVEAPDWKETTECGGGLHGYLMGEGNWKAGRHNDDSKWLVVKIDSYIDLDGKVKFQKGDVVFCGTLYEASTYIRGLGADGAVIGTSVTVDTKMNIMGGAKSYIKVGPESTVTAGSGSTVTAGNYAKVTAGNDSTVTAGEYATVTAGGYATVTAGIGSTIIYKYYKNGFFWRTITGYVGEDLKPNTPYKLVYGAFVEVAE